MHLMQMHYGFDDYNDVRTADDTNTGLELQAGWTGTLAGDTLTPPAYQVSRAWVVSWM